jgi:hypothetical protein
MTKLNFLLASLLITSFALTAQDDEDVLGRQDSRNLIRTTIPFITIAPDSRAGAMGDAGVATSPDLSSQNWNAAKYTFMPNKMGFAVSYTPWLRSLGVNDLNLAYLSGFYQFDGSQAISLGLRYFSLGDVIFTQGPNDPGITVNPNEFAMDVGYSRKFSEYFSSALVFRYIRSDIAGGQGLIGTTEYNPGFSFAADISGYYQRAITLGDNDAEMAFGFNISNIGTKMSYTTDDNKQFIPTNLKLGGRLSLDMDEYNAISFTLDINKLLVPSPPLRSTENPDSIIAGHTDDVGVIQGMIQSFYDAPDGFKEEMREIMLSFGVEYWYRDQFALRAGYFHENELKGSRKYFTAGAGIKLNVLSLDFSYLFPAQGGRNNPLANTMRFTLGFSFE